MKIFRYLTAIVLILSLGACGKNGADPKDPKSREFELYIDFSKTFAGIAVTTKYTNVVIDNVRIIDNNNVNFKIEDITAYEWREDINDWKIDVEFTMNFDPVQDLAIMMVLDASASLGQDFEKVKQYASNFITKVLTDIPNAKIGIVDFSDEIHSFPPTNNKV